jgi:molybdopterin converting factor small subunit
MMERIGFLEPSETRTGEPAKSRRFTGPGMIPGVFYPSCMSSQDTNDQADKSGITVRCNFFARYAELLDCTELELDLSGGVTVADVVNHVRAYVPGGQQLPAAPLVAKNQQHVTHDCVVEDGDELAFLPPLGGG